MSTLSLHAKTYYDDPSFDGAGDEHYLDFSGNFSDGAIIYPNYRSTGFTLSSGSMWIQGTPFGGYLHIFVKVVSSPHREEYAGWANAELTLSTDISYWGSVPTGYYGSENWQASLAGTNWKVTRVTV